MTNDMFASKDEVRGLIDAAYALFARRARGSVVPHEEIAAATGLEPESKPYRYVMERIKAKALKERGIAVHAVRTVGLGYKLLTKDEQADEPVRYLRKMKRAARRGKKAVEALPTQALTMNQQLRRAFGSQLLKDEIASISRNIRMGETLGRVPEAMPRPRFAVRDGEPA